MNKDMRATPLRTADGFPRQPQRIEVEHVRWWKNELASHGSAVCLVARQGEKALDAGCREVRLLVRANRDRTAIREFLAEFRLARIAGTGEFHELPPRHIADADDVVAVINLDAVFVEASGLAALAGAHFDVLKLFVIAALRPVWVVLVLVFHLTYVVGNDVPC